jgi:hypothetical protein
MKKISGGITKHLSGGYSPYYLIEDSDLSSYEWRTFDSSELKEQYKEYVCPVCENLHLMRGQDETLFGHCLTNTNSQSRKAL